MAVPLNKKIVMQTGMFATMGVGMMVLRKAFSTRLHEKVLHCETLVKSHPAIANLLGELVEIASDEEGQRILSSAEEIAQHDAKRLPESQWHIVRLTSDVVKQAKSICASVSHTSSDEMFRRSVSCEQDVIPQLEGMLDDLLHNHLLSLRGGRV